MGLITDAATRLKNAIGDLFPEEQPSATPVFPTNAPAPISEPVITIRKSAKTPPFPQNPESKPLGKITSFNYEGDPYTDSLSKKGIGAFGKITNEGIAVSPDVEQAFREAGIKPRDRVIFDMKDGSEESGIWQDRTMQDKQAIKAYGNPLRGRIDFNMARGKSRHPKDGMEVVGFRKAE
jgi:hypothetical protein